MDRLTIERLRERIIEHIQNGGSIYDKKNDLPYYDSLRYVKSCLTKESGREVSFEEVYALCGFKFDRNYHEATEEYKQFLSFYEKVRGFSDENGNVDAMRDPNVRKIDDTYNQLKNYADKYDTSPFDFLVLMTGYKFKKAYIPINYVDYLSQRLKQAYPKGNIDGIKREHPDLYESIRHLRKYLPEQLSMQEVAEFLGVSNDRFGEEKLHTKINKQQLLQELAEVCPDRNVTHLQDINVDLYRKSIELSRMEDKTPYQWFDENQFNYDFKINVARLSKASVDTNARAKKLLEMRADFLDNFDLENVDDIERYKISIEMLKYVNEQIKNKSFAELGIENVETEQQYQQKPMD